MSESEISTWRFYLWPFLDFIRKWLLLFLNTYFFGWYTNENSQGSVSILATPRPAASAAQSSLQPDVPATQNLGRDVSDFVLHHCFQPDRTQCRSTWKCCCTASKSWPRCRWKWTLVHGECKLVVILQELPPVLRHRGQLAPPKHRRKKLHILDEHGQALVDVLS